MDSALVTIVVCCKAGTEKLMEVWSRAVSLHTKRVPFRVEVLSTTPMSLGFVPFEWHNTIVPLVQANSRNVHGKMLDWFIPDSVRTEYVLTMDSDCMPIADDWLDELIRLIKNGAMMSGILQPWAPPNQDMDKKKIEWRVMSQHCWANTHVACQMLRLDDLKRMGVKYDAGDDTGFQVVSGVRALGGSISGFLPSRCPMPKVEGVDPEFNRYVCVVFGDRMVHLGGTTRKKEPDYVESSDPLSGFGKAYGWALDRVMEEGGEFLLKEENSYRFKFDREKEVAADKMVRLFGLDSQRMRCR